ncbi:MAG: hypothetical protein JRH17_17540 [Deltaproteobacteria bacterium]|nr:hypothetical protein [Deltaproteobacteria bacterium]
MVLTTDAFALLARESARNEGIEEARILTLSHPIGGESEEALFAKADQALDALLALASQPA